MTTWLRERREALLHQGLWHLEHRASTAAAILGRPVMFCDTPIDGQHQETLEDPPLDDRCPFCQSVYLRRNPGSVRRSTSGSAWQSDTRTSAR